MGTQGTAGRFSKDDPWHIHTTPGLTPTAHHSPTPWGAQTAMPARRMSSGRRGGWGPGASPGPDGTASRAIISYTRIYTRIAGPGTSAKARLPSALGTYSTADAAYALGSFPSLSLRKRELGAPLTRVLSTALRPPLMWRGSRVMSGAGEGRDEAPANVLE